MSAINCTTLTSTISTSLLKFNIPSLPILFISFEANSVRQTATIAINLIESKHKTKPASQSVVTSAESSGSFERALNLLRYEYQMIYKAVKTSETETSSEIHQFYMYANFLVSSKRLTLLVYISLYIISLTYFKHEKQKRNNRKNKTNKKYAKSFLFLMRTMLVNWFVYV